MLAYMHVYAPPCPPEIPRIPRVIHTYVLCGYGIRTMFDYRILHLRFIDYTIRSILSVYILSIS